MSFSANVERLKPSATIAVSSLAKRLRAEGKDIIDLSAGEPDFPTPEWISDAAVDGIRASRTRYTPTAGVPELRQAIADRLGERAGREIEPERVVVSTGAKQSLFNACFTLFGPDDEVLIAAPYWTSYPQMVVLSRAEPVPVAGSEDRGFRVTPEDLEAASGGRTRGLILSTPCNPTGSVYSMNELRAVAEWARDRGVWLICDEIYRLIHFGEGPAPGLLELPPASLGPHVLVDGASKAFAMTGWRLGFAATDVDLAAKMAAFQSHVTSNAATPSQMAALAAFGTPDRADASVREMRAAFHRRRDLVTRLFEERLPRFSFVEPRGAFYLFVRVDVGFADGRHGSAEFCSWLLREAGVALVPGTAFGDDRYARLSFATSDDLLERAVERIANALG